MSAPETLRRAAAHLRELAKVGDPLNYPLPWGTEQADIEHYGVASYVTCAGGKGELTDALDDDVARYFAAMHPGIAVFLADLLDYEAERAEDPGARRPGAAFALARALLGDIDA